MGSNTQTARTDAAIAAASHNLESLENRNLFAVSLGSDGWTDVTPSSDTRIVYVSSSAGSDSNSGLSAGAAVKSLAKARTLLRDGSPDHLLLKRGDEWSESFSNWTLSGRSEQEPMLIGTFGAGDRPVLNTGTGVGFKNADQVSHLVIQGIHFHAHTRDTDAANYGGATTGNYGFHTYGRMHDVLVEDAVFDDYMNNLSVTGYDARVTDFVLRRSVVTDAWSTTGKAQGIYVHKVDGILLEENVFDHNGWNTDVAGAEANVHSHNIYMSSDNTGVAVRGNVIADASSHGIQARSGGIIENNLFLRNPINLLFGGGSPTIKAGGVSGRVTGNVILDSRDINGSNRGTAMEFSNIRPGGVLVANNIITADTHRHMSAITFGTTSDATNVADAVGLNDLTIRDNIVYDWYSAFNMSDAFQTGGSGNVAVNNVRVIDNDFQLSGSSRLVRHGPAVNAGEFFWSGNRYANRSTISPSGWFAIGNTTNSFTSWKSKVEPTAVTETVDYADPVRSIGTYLASLGMSTNLSTFVNAAADQARGAFDARFSAAAVINHVRQGFAEDGVVPGGLLELIGSGTQPAPQPAPTPDDGGKDGQEPIDMSPPSIPTVLRATGASPSTNGLTWVASTDNVSVAGYEIFRDGVRVATVTGTSWTDTGLTSGTAYVYRMRAFDAAGNVSAWSNNDTGTTHTAASTPAAPTSLTASRLWRRRVRLTWTDRASNERGFAIWSSIDGSTWTKYATVGAKSGTGSTTSFTTDSFSSGTRYFRVTAFNLDGHSPASSVVEVRI